MVFEVKAHMIVKEVEARGILDTLIDPFAKGIGLLVSMVREHPFLAILALAILLVLVWRLVK